jgi:hypothetical protein
VSRTPAAELARLKVAFPDWAFRQLTTGGYTARRKLPDGTRQTVRGRTLADIEYQLRLLERGELPGRPAAAGSGAAAARPAARRPLPCNPPLARRQRRAEGW